MKQIGGGHECTDFYDKHYRVPVENAWIELCERFEDCAANQCGEIVLFGGGFHGRRHLEQLSSSHLQVLEDGAEAEDRKKRESADDQYGGNEKG